MNKPNVYAGQSGLIQRWILSSLFALGFGGLGRRGNGQNLLHGVLEFDAVQSQINGFGHNYCEGALVFSDKSLASFRSSALVDLLKYAIGSALN